MAAAELLALLRDASQIAHDLGFSLYIVGGFVRDLLLNQPNFDLDLVVEGDAIALAQALQKKYGGRVHGHTRFGTAKWIIKEEKGQPAKKLLPAFRRSPRLTFPPRARNFTRILLRCRKSKRVRSNKTCIAAILRSTRSQFVSTRIGLGNCSIRSAVKRIYSAV